MFEIHTNYGEHTIDYCVLLYHNNNEYFFPKSIHPIIGISHQEYIDVLLSFGAELNTSDNLQHFKLEYYYFTNEDNCRKCINFLNEKYGLLIKLLG